MLIDSNIFLEVLLDKKKADECIRFLESVASREKIAYLSTFTIDSIIIIMENNKLGIEKIKIFINSLLNYNGLKIYSPTVSDRINAIEYINEDLDFEDSLTLQCALSTNQKEILSFDKDFDKTKAIKRVTPDKL